ncbi:MAG: OPA family sugar phosphate sensor protein UhpC-like MFS transporter [Cellvibrionaceae bacterium]|jgi:OPA family sugar phosphate sensor protein UhpC-like MFS transporter
MIGPFKALPNQPVSMSADEINKSYQHWRIHILISMYVGYAIFYFTRKSFNYAMPALIEDLGLTKGDIGIIGTVFYLTYGFSKFVSGMASDSSNPRYFMGVGLIATGIINIIFGLSSSLSMFIGLWVLNAFFQGWGWPPCSKLLTTWYSHSERGFWWSIWNTSHNLGGALIPMLVGFVTLYFGWRMGMIVPGVIGIIIGLLLCYRLRDKPQTMGLPSVGVWRNDQAEIAREAIGSDLTKVEIIKKYVLGNKFIWLLAASYILVYIVRTAINDWGNLYLTEEKGYGLIKANSALSLFEIGGFIGSLMAGWGSDKFFNGNRGPMNVLFSIGIFVSIIAVWMIPNSTYSVQAACFFAIGFFVFGPQMLIGMSAAEYSHKNAAGAATGFVGLFGYMGAALSGYPLALIMERWGWQGFFIVVAIASGLAGMLLLTFWKDKVLT